MKLLLLKTTPARLLKLTVVMVTICLILPEAAFSQQKENYLNTERTNKKTTAPETRVVAALSANTHEAAPFRVITAQHNTTDKKASDSIQNGEDKFLYNEYYTSEENKRTTNLSEIGQGLYKLRFRAHRNSKSNRVIRDNVNRKIQMNETSLFSTPNMIVSFHLVDETKVVLHVDNHSNKGIQIVLQDISNKILLRKVETGKQTLLAFDMAQMKDGEYKFTIVSDFNIITEKFRISTTSERSVGHVNIPVKTIEMAALTDVKGL